MRVNEEARPLLQRYDSLGAHISRNASYIRHGLRKCMPTLALLVIPHLMGLIQAVQIPAEMDAIRSLSCAHYYYLNPEQKNQEDDNAIDATSCLRPEVEQHFSKIATFVTFSVVLANFVGMLIWVRRFDPKRRRSMAAKGMCGSALARVPFLVLPLYQFPFLASPNVLSLSPSTMLLVFWACAVLGGLSGTNELVSLTVESFITDSSSPEVRSQLLRYAQVATLLGASLGPLLGSMSTWIFPNAHNACIGYRTCQQNRLVLGRAVLFNNAPYWLAFGISLLGWTWVWFALASSGTGDGLDRDDLDDTSSLADSTSVDSSTRASRNRPTRRDTAEWGASLGAFQRLLPVRMSRWSYDTRILQFTAADMCIALTQEGPVALIFVLGFVFRWSRDALSVGLAVFNSLRLVHMAILLPIVLHRIVWQGSKPAPISELTPKQLDACFSVTKEAFDRPHRRRDSFDSIASLQHILDHVSSEQYELARLWRAQVDLHASRISFFINATSWMTIFAGVYLTKQWLLMAGATALAFGCGAQFLLRSAACTICDSIVDKRAESLQLHLPTSNTHTGAHSPTLSPTGPVASSATSRPKPLPSGSDSYLVISSTLMLPCLLLGLCLRNEIYTRTLATNPGAFFIVIAGIETLGLLALCPIQSASITTSSTFV